MMNPDHFDQEHQLYQCHAVRSPNETGILPLTTIPEYEEWQRWQGVVAFSHLLKSLLLEQANVHGETIILHQMRVLLFPPQSQEDHLSWRELYHLLHHVAVYTEVVQLLHRARELKGKQHWLRVPLP
jgi:hypothetical protein